MAYYYLHDKFLLEKQWSHNLPSESDISLASADAPVEFSLTSDGVLSPDVMVTSSPIMALKMFEGSQPSFPSAFTYHISAKK